MLFDTFSISHTTTMHGFSSLLPGQAVSLHLRQQAGKSLFRGEAGYTSNIGLAQSLYLKRVFWLFGVSHTPIKSSSCSSPQLLWLGGPAEGGEGTGHPSGGLASTCSLTCTSSRLIYTQLVQVELCACLHTCWPTTCTSHNACVHWPAARAAQFQIGTSW